MLPFVFSTRLVPVGEQYDYWRNWKLPLLDVTSGQEAREGFDATLSAWKIGDGLLLTEMEAPAATNARSSGLLRHTPDDHWVISRLLSGTMTVETPKGTITVVEGGSYVWSLGQPSESVCSRLRRLDLYLSRDIFRGIAPVLDAVTGSLLDGPLEQALGKFLVKMEERLPEIPAHNSRYLLDAVREVVVSTLAPMARQQEGAQGPSNAGRLEIVRRAVCANLQSPHLDTQTLCREVGMSRSSLYRLLERVGGVSSYIQRHRLEEARNRLCDSRNDKPIEAIAGDLCFADASTFSRAFRAAFGMSPSEARTGSAKAGLQAYLQTAMPEPSATRFVELLRP